MSGYNFNIYGGNEQAEAEYVPPVEAKIAANSLKRFRAKHNL